MTVGRQLRRQGFLDEYGTTVDGSLTIRYGELIPMQTHPKVVWGFGVGSD